MARVLFIASHRKDRAPGQRFRFEQYLGHLTENGIECEVSNLVSEEVDQVLYQPGHYFAKARFVHESHRIRRADVARVADYDIVFIFREALMTRSIRYERMFASSPARIVFDFDDAIWLPNVSDANRAFRWMKNPEKTSRLIGLADLVFAGNEYLADYARRFTSSLEIVPTTIDTNEYQRSKLPKRDTICIGWSGSVTTIQHFDFALPFLRAAKEKYRERVTFKVIGDERYANEELGINGVAWSKSSEVEELSGIDIGIMPLPDDEWAKGKCGLKALQYMALEVPTIMSPVGVNRDIVKDGENGFLATTTSEWMQKLGYLIEDPGVREGIGRAARSTVVQRYSVESQKDHYLQYFRQLLDR